MTFDKNTSKLSLSKLKREKKAPQLQSNEQSSETINDPAPLIQNTTAEQKASEFSIEIQEKIQQIQSNPQFSEAVNDAVTAVINDSSSLIKETANNSKLPTEKDEVANTSQVKDSSTTKPKIIAPNPCLRELLSQCAVEQLLEFAVKKNDILGIISNDPSASNSKEKILSNLMGTSDYFQEKPSLKDIVGELLQLVFEICIEMEDKQLDINSFQANDDFQKLVLGRVILFM